jgi:lysine 6-dehydrogenase
MKILVLGSGLMGPAAAYNALSDRDVAQVTLCDLCQQQLQAARTKLLGLLGGQRLSTVNLDLRDQAAARRLMSAHDAVVAALPKEAIALGIRAAASSRTPLVDLSWPPADQVAGLRAEVEAAGTLVLLGCGVEPGLTEIMARHLAEKLDRVQEVHIKVGGIPEQPAPPLGYKILFGGRQLPLREGEMGVVSGGRLQSVPRYSGVERTTFAGVGEVEAWHEGFMPWLLELDALQGLQVGTQKTIRWPGYAAKAALLCELGLLSQEPIEVDGLWVAPKRLLDALLYPRVRFEKQDRDLTLFRVEVLGEHQGWPRRYKIEMVDRYDERLGFTSMARTTAFTGAIVARMMARGELQARGLLTPEQVIAGPPFDRLVVELAAAGVRFEITSEQVQALGPGER